MTIPQRKIESRDICRFSSRPWCTRDPCYVRLSVNQRGAMSRTVLGAGRSLRDCARWLKHADGPSRHAGVRMS